jgi:hypothetical protein
LNRGRYCQSSQASTSNTDITSRAHDRGSPKPPGALRWIDCLEISMSLGTIILIVLVVALLGGFSGVGGGRSTAPATTAAGTGSGVGSRAGFGVARQNLKSDAQNPGTCLPLYLGELPLRSSARGGTFTCDARCSSTHNWIAKPSGSMLAKSFAHDTRVPFGKAVKKS